MRRLLHRLWPDHIAAQIALLMFAAITFFQITVTSTYLFSEPEWRMPIVEPGEFIASVLTAIDAADPAQRAGVVADYARLAPWLRILIQDGSPSRSRVAPAGGAAALIREKLWPNAIVRVPTIVTEHPGGDFAIALRKGGYAIVAVLEPRRSLLAERARSGDGLWGLLSIPNLERSAALFLLCVLVLTLWMSGAVVAPLVRLARQAETFPGESNDAAPVAETGPKEVRDLSRALNRMQDRIHQMIESRGRALAAISHDLRTIITRIRLRAEFIGDESLKAKMRDDVETMDAMLHKNLLYLRGEETQESHSPIDLDSVLQTIADQFTDMGHAVAYRGGGRQTVYGSLDEVQRLFSNLVENAASYGEHVEISVAAPDNGLIAVDVADDGPGIAAQDKARVIEPFVRGQPARNMNARGGFGLGLSIVTALVEKAGGRLELLDRAPHGLIARVALPIAPR